MTAPATLAEALAALQAQMPRVTKKHDAEVTSQRTGKTFKYDYADLTDVTEALYPVMAPLGLSFTAMPTVMDDGGRFVLDYALKHVSGETISGLYPLPDPEKVGPQDLGKAITYARRYALCAVTGLAPGGDDDDAQGAQDAARSRSLPAAPERKPRNTGTDAQLTAEGRMTRAQKAAHEKLEADTKDPRGHRAERSRPRAPDPADPWTADHADYVTGQRAEEIRTEGENGYAPEEAPGSMTEPQHRAIEKMLSFLGKEKSMDRHGTVVRLLNLPGLESISDLSFAQAAALLPKLNDEAARIRLEATANAT